MRRIAHRSIMGRWEQATFSSRGVMGRDGVGIWESVVENRVEGVVLVMYVDVLLSTMVVK